MKKFRLGLKIISEVNGLCLRTDEEAYVPEKDLLQILEENSTTCMTPKWNWSTPVAVSVKFQKHLNNEGEH